MCQTMDRIGVATRQEEGGGVHTIMLFRLKLHMVIDGVH